MEEQNPPLWLMTMEVRKNTAMKNPTRPIQDICSREGNSWPLMRYVLSLHLVVLLEWWYLLYTWVLWLSDDCIPRWKYSPVLRCKYRWLCSFMCFHLSLQSHREGCSSRICFHFHETRNPSFPYLCIIRDCMIKRKVWKCWVIIWLCPKHKSPNHEETGRASSLSCGDLEEWPDGSEMKPVLRD